MVEAMVLRCVDVIMPNDDILPQTIELRKKYGMKIPDAIIAATAMAHDAVLYTRNVSDFSCVKGLKLKEV